MRVDTMEALTPEAVDRICRMAVDHRRPDGGSLRNLVAAVRYRELRSQLTPEILQEGLTREPSLVDEWMLYSADKRTTGWYLEAVNGGWTVGYIAPRGSAVDPHLPSRHFRSSLEACSVFILCELDSCAGLAPKPAR